MIRSLVIAAAALLLVTAPVHADVIYEYAGNAFTSWTGAGCQGDCAISIVLGFPAVLPANFVSSNPLSVGAAHPWTISDGQITLDANQPVHHGAIWITGTDAQGLPTEWNVWVEDVSGPRGSAVRGLTSIGCLSSAGCVSEQSSDSIILRDSTGVITHQASNLAAPGTWRIVTVPEPATFGCVAIGLTVLLVSRRIRRN